MFFVFIKNCMLAKFLINTKYRRSLMFFVFLKNPVFSVK